MRWVAHVLWMVSLLAALGIGVRPVHAQCASGDVLWVSEDVDANVGLGGGAAGTCGSRTVSGAACNDSGMPFGIQAAFDCVRPGAEIRILAGNGNYGSTTNSWNNRVSANQAIIPNIAGASDNAIVVRGYVDVSTPCLSFRQTGCPVTLDFTGGSSIGLDPSTLLVSYGWVGLRIMGAAGDCADTDLSFRGAMWVMEFDNCGGIGVDNAAANAWTFLYAHDNATDGAQAGTSNSFVFSEFHDNGNHGLEYSIGTGVERALSYDNGSSGISSSSGGQSTFWYITFFNNVANGLGGGSADNTYNGGWGLISTSNDFGMEGYVTPAAGQSSMSLFQCWFAGGNASGAIANPTSPTYAGIRNAANITDIPTFASATDFSVSGVSPCTFTYPGGSSLTSCPGASPSCGGVGLFIQAVR